MPPKRKPANPIGPGKKGSVKRKLYKQGAGKKSLRAYRSLSPKGKKAFRAATTVTTEKGTRKATAKRVARRLSRKGVAVVQPKSGGHAVLRTKPRRGRRGDT